MDISEMYLANLSWTDPGKKKHCPFGTKIDQLSDCPMVKKLLLKKKDNNNKELIKERNKITPKRHEELSNGASASSSHIGKIYP